jgi:hypothetical protein
MFYAVMLIADAAPIETYYVAMSLHALQDLPATIGEFKVRFRSRFGRDLGVDLELQKRPNPISTLTPHDFDLIRRISPPDFACRIQIDFEIKL